MDRAPKTEAINGSQIEKRVEETGGIESAIKILSKLKAYDGETVVGNDNLLKVEALARELDENLKAIPISVRQQYGLPWHPLAPVANDEKYQVAA